MDRADEIDILLAEREIRATLARYCRGIDRFDLAMVRSCYHPDATDDHGHYRGNVDGFITWLEPVLARWQTTMHFLGQCDIEVRGDVAATETYAVAYHRGINPAGVLADHIVGLRYLDRFERHPAADRNGDQPQWLIAERTCALDWRRDDAVAGSGEFPSAYTRGVRSPDDPVYRLFDFTSAESAE